MANIVSNMKYDETEQKLKQAGYVFWAFSSWGGVEVYSFRDLSTGKSVDFNKAEVAEILEVEVSRIKI